MARYDSIEEMARQLAAYCLRDPRWEDRLEEICRTLRADALRAEPRRPMIAVAARAEAMLRHIFHCDPVSIGRLYFDLLPRQPGHPLTERVIAALADPANAIALLRDAGLHPRVGKDDDGTSVIEISLPEETPALCDAARDAIVTALLAGETAPRRAIHTIH